MIDIFYIDSAKAIRKEYLRLSISLEKYENDLRMVSKILMDTAGDLEKYSKDKIDKETNIESIKNYIVGRLDYLESESNKLAKKINPVNEGIEKLKQDEVNLYNAIRHKYPNLTDDELVSEIQRHLDE